MLRRPPAGPGLPQRWTGVEQTEVSNQLPDASSARPPVGHLIVAAFTVVFVFFVGIGGWAAWAPLESAAIAQGRVTVASHRKSVQHLEGGIIDELLIKEGDEVSAGQVLVRLDETKAQAAVARLRARLDALLAAEARLIAERDGVDLIDFPNELLDRAEDPEVISILDSQLSIFEARRETLEGQVDILEQRIGQLHKEIEALDAQVAAQERQRDLIRKEERTVDNLVKRGLAEMPRLLALQRTSANIIGTLGEQEALIARAEQRIGETRLEILDQRNAFRSKVVGELHETQAEVIDISEQMTAAEDVMKRTKITAPQSGKVVNLRYHTTGGVLAPGDVLLDIVPQDDALVVEARINTTDIDVVRVGLPALVKLLAYKSRHTLPLKARVSHVSADTISDQRTGHPFYQALVTIDEEQESDLAKRDLYPGMPAQVMVITGKRTGLEYAIQPLKESFSRAFRED